MSNISWPRCIAHLDLDAFYATVEEVLNPALKGVPLMVVMGDDLGNRGAIATASYAARRLGVHSAMSVANARKLCPDGVYLPVRHHLYREFSQKVMTLLAEEAAALEQVSIDEAYMDLGQIADPPALAQHLQSRIIAEIGLSASVGVATNKLTAKMASGHLKPGGLTVVPPGEEASFLAPLPVGKLHGVGPKTAARLQAIGIQTIGDLAEADIEMLRTNFGPNNGLEMQQHAAGIDHREIETNREIKSLSYERTFLENNADRRDLWHNIQEMATGLEGRLHKNNLLARTVSIKLRFSNWKTITRAETLLTPTDKAATIAASAGRLMRLGWRRGTPLRLLGVRVSNFVEIDAPRQTSFEL